MRKNIADVLLQPLNTGGIILLAVYTMLWGVWLMFPFWDTFTAAQLYSVMSAVMPELAWGIIAFAAGVVMAYGVLKPSYKSLTRGAWVGGMHWLAIAVMYFIGDYTNTGGITSLIFAAYACWIYVNIRVNKVLHTDTSKEKEGF